MFEFLASPLHTAQLG